MVCFYNEQLEPADWNYALKEIRFNICYNTERVSDFMKKFLQCSCTLYSNRFGKSSCLSYEKNKENKDCGHTSDFQACYISFEHSHKKRVDNLEGSLARVLFAAELEFPKTLVPRLPQNTSNVNIESSEKSKQLYYLCDQLIGALIYLHFIVLMLICFNTGRKTLLQLLLKGDR